MFPVLLAVWVQLVRGACTAEGAPLPVGTVTGRLSGTDLAKGGASWAATWQDDGGAHLAVIDERGRLSLERTVSPKGVVPVDLVLLGDEVGWAVVIRSSQWSDKQACTVAVTRMDLRGHRSERRVVIENACPVELPALAAALSDGTVFVAATTSGAPGQSAIDLRLARWAPAPALPESLDALYVAAGPSVGSLVPTEAGLELLWATGSGPGRTWQVSHLDAHGVPKGLPRPATAPLPSDERASTERTEGEVGARVEVQGEALTWQALRCSP